MLLTNYSVELPPYLDDYIFQSLGAIYRKSGPVFVSNVWDYTKTLEYLGTYFPRSYSESFCIFSDYFQNAIQKCSMKEELCIFDLGCGTGGEIIGLIDAIRCKLSNLKRVVVRAVDGNPYAVELCRNIIEYYKTQVGQGLTIDAGVVEGRFSNYEELVDLASRMGITFDIIMSFKALNEVILTGSWGARNPYKDFLDTFCSHLSDGGILCMAEVDTPVELMDCPMMVGYGACNMSMVGECRVRQMADFLIKESDNDWARIVPGACPLMNTGACCYKSRPPVLNGRNCLMALSNVYYRDLMRQATLCSPLLCVRRHNLDANATGKEAEKRFYVTHSHAQSRDCEGLFYAISTVRPLPTDDDLPW